MKHYDILVVGAGHGGAQAALALRQHKFEGTIALVGDEPDPPYERPPLSKEYLSGAKSLERLFIRPPAFWNERNIDLLLAQRAVKVDPAAHSVTLASGTSLHYDTLIWATGGAARRLTCPGHDLPNIFGVRTRADVDAMLAGIDAVKRVVVIGGGYIGLEAAAVLTEKFGIKVTVLEALDRVLSRVAAEPLSRFYEAEHRANGVDIRLGVHVDGIEETAGRATGVRLADGSVIPADMVIVGIGIAPAVEPLLAAGAAGDNGVSVDAHCRTSLDDVFAIGDCAKAPQSFADGVSMRVESVQNASHQATLVAKTIMGNVDPDPAVPWFWSNQYDLKLQTVGLNIGYDEIVLRGDMSKRSFSLIYLKSSRVIALDCVNATKDYVQGRALVVDRNIVAPDILCDPRIAMKDMPLLRS